MRNYLKFIFPLVLIAFCLITAKARVQYDPTQGNLYGFPLFWYCEGVNSMSWAIDIPSMLIDFAVYALLGAILSAAVPNSLLEKMRFGAILSAVLYCIAVSVIFFKILPFAFDTSFHSFEVYRDHYLNIITYGTHIGFP